MALVPPRTLPFALILLAAAGFSICCSNNASSAPAAPEQKTEVPRAAPVPATPATVAPDNRPVIVAYGDSLSAGFGADPGKSYPDYLQKLIDADHLKYRVNNAGVSGDTTTDGLERLPGILTLKPAIAILELGGNDGLRGLPIATTKANLDKMIVALQSSGAKVILAGMTLPRNYGPEYIHQFEQIYVQLANEHHLIRIPFLLDGVATVPRLMQADSIHPTAEGNSKVAVTVYKYLKPALRIN